MSQSKSKRVSSAKVVGTRNEINLRLFNTSSSKRQSNHSPSGNLINQTKANNSRRSAYICSGCGKPIKRDKFLLKACDKYWHENCLKCDRCHSRLGELGSTLYCKSNMNLCRQDYLEMFGKTGVCSVCEKMICASEMVMRAKQNVYHLECFACQLCNQRFCVGDRFYLCENKVVCQYDYEEHILPIQQSMIEQTSDSIIYPVVTSNTITSTTVHLEPTSTIHLDTNRFNVVDTNENVSIDEQNPLNETICNEPEVTCLSKEGAKDLNDKETMIEPDEKFSGENQQVKSEAISEEVTNNKTGAEDSSKDFEVPSKEERKA